MKVNISSLEDLSSILNSIKNTAVKNIQIIIIDSSIVPYLDHFIDCCNDLNCNVKVNSCSLSLISWKISVIECK